MKTKKLFASIFIFIFLLTVNNILAQKIGFINSEIIRQKFPEAQLAEQRLQSMLEEWKREANNLTNMIEDLEFEIRKNRLIWSDAEKAEKDKRLQALIDGRESFVKSKYAPNGEYDLLAKRIMAPVEERIYQATMKVSQEQRVDFVFDQSLQPMPVSNYKYDLTVLVLKELGVDVDKMQEELQQKIDKDPRNEQKEQRTPRSREPQKRYDPTSGKEVSNPEGEEQERSFQRRRR